MKKILLGLAATGTTLALIPLFAAFEAHVINVTATIENALSVPVTPIQFGTVFPQEHLEKNLPIRLSASFLEEDRVDDVEYFIRQKPKCAWSWQEDGVWMIDENSTQTGHVSLGTSGEVIVDCGPQTEPPQGVPQGAIWGQLPMLCPYISKTERTEDGSETNNDGALPSFHQPFSVVDGKIVWTDVKGRLSKIAGDEFDDWIIDLAVPCFGGYCAQDWANFVHSHNQNADPDEYTQPIANEHKVFGCDLWVEVSEVSETPLQ